MKRFERGYEFGQELPAGLVRLAGIDVDLNRSEVLLEKDTFCDSDLEELFEVKTGEWYTKDGWIVGKNPKMCPGMIVSKQNYFGDVMLEATVRMVEPSTHDVNFMINGEWIEEKNQRGLAYVAGLEAFWHGNIGFEKSPEYKLIGATQLFEFDPIKEYRFRLGNAGGRIFVMVDDRLCLEIRDPDPIDGEKYGKIGFEAFSSWWQFKHLKVYRLSYERVREYYHSEF